MCCESPEQVWDEKGQPFPLLQEQVLRQSQTEVKITNFSVFPQLKITGGKKKIRVKDAQEPSLLLC